MIAAAAATFLALPLLVLLTDFAVFAATARAYDRPAGTSAYMAFRTGAVTLEQVAPVRAAAAPPRNYRTEPLTPEEKAALTAGLSAVLPPAPPGWTLAPYAEADYWVMRPEQAHCRDRSIDPATVNPIVRDCPADVADGLAMAYARGSERIVVRLIHGADGASAETIRRGSGLLETFFRRRGEPPELLFDQYGLWRFESMTNFFSREGWPSLKTPTRLHAQRMEAGVVDIWVVSNAGAHSLRPLLGRIDYRKLDALIAAPAAEG